MSAKSVPGRPRQRAATRPTDRRAVLRRLAADSVEAVVNNIRTWLFALLGAVATLFLTIGGLRLMWANGDPGEAEKGKAALKSAAIGYALALLSPLIVTVVAGWVK